MHPVMAPNEVATVATRGRREATPPHRTTTLYAVIAALQAVVAPQDDALVVVTMVHLLQSRRLTWLETDQAQRRV